MTDHDAPAAAPADDDDDSTEECNDDKLELQFQWSSPAFMFVIWLKAWEIFLVFAHKEFPPGNVMTIYRRHQNTNELLHLNTLLRARSLDLDSQQQHGCSSSLLSRSF